MRLISSPRNPGTNVVGVLIGGFALVIVLLLAAGSMGVSNIVSIRRSAARLVNESLVTTQLIDEVQRERGTLNAVFYNMGGEPDQVDRDDVLRQLDQADEAIERIVTSGEDTPEQPLWHQLKESTTGFTTEARRLLALEDAPTLSSLYLLRRHDEVVILVSKLIGASAQHAAESQQSIQQNSSELVRESAILLGASVLLALVFAVLTVRLVLGLFRQMEWQSSELSRVSWQLLENQETVAKRFSHELHDELGQSLTAVKVNLASLAAKPELDQARLTDCRQLVDEAIQNVRELSQLLHPTILDDFGLDVALRSLVEGFGQRTGLTVEYQSSFDGRLSPEIETHFFRIAQEALTNVARHSGATRVEMKLARQGDRLHLTIVDNGKGLTDGEQRNGSGIGMIGMRARARSLGGEFTTHSTPGQGVTIEVWAPAVAAPVEEHDPHPVG